MSTPDRNETVLKSDSRIHSATDTQYRYTLHVPCQFNDGSPLQPIFVASLEHKLVAMFGGFTRVESWGGWQFPDGSVCIEDMTLYHIDCTSDQCGNAIREIAAQIREDLRQECVYVTRQAIDTWLV